MTLFRRYAADLARTCPGPDWLRAWKEGCRNA